MKSTTQESLTCSKMGDARSTWDASNLPLNRMVPSSLTVTSNMSEASLQDEIRAAIANPLVRDVVADLHDGYISVTAERERPGSDEIDIMTFRLDLGVTNGHLSAEISDAQVNGEPLDEALVAAWNESIATRLERASARNPNSTLHSVTIGEDALTMTWRVETWRSGSGG